MKFALVVALATLSMTNVAAANAAESIVVPVSDTGEIPVHNNQGYDWSGFYAGIYGVGQAGLESLRPGVGIQAGVNAQFGFYLLGAELAVHGLPEGKADIGGASYGQILGRAGLAVSDDAIVYAAGGFGIDLGAPDDQHLLAGAGAEFALNERVSIDAQYLHGFPIAGGESIDQVTLGANWHF